MLLRRTKADKLWIPLSLLGALMIALGALRGEVAVVLNKAIKICLECIGVG